MALTGTRRTSSSAFPSCRQDPTVLSSNIQEYEDEHEDVDEEQEVQEGLRNPIEISSGRMPELTEDAGVGWTPLRLALVQLWDVKLPQLGRRGGGEGGGGEGE